jgi:cell division transport system permease protein
MAGFLHFKPDIPFSRDDTNRFLPWIIAFIVFVASMMLACGMGLYDVVGGRHLAQVNSISVHIPPPAEGKTGPAGEVLATLKKMPGVEKAELLSDAQLRALVKPWLGGDVPTDALPLPRVIDVTFSSDKPDMDALEKTVTGIAPGATIDDHARWIAQYASLITALQWGLWAAAALFIVTTLSIVVLTTRASIKIHHRVIHILHAIGALDSYIARQFQVNAFLIAAKGAFFGCLFSLGFYLALCVMTGKFEVPLMPEFTLGAWQIGLYAGLPFVVGIGALISSRLTVLAELRRMP